MRKWQLDLALFKGILCLQKRDTKPCLNICLILTVAFFAPRNSYGLLKSLYDLQIDFLGHEENPGGRRGLPQQDRPGVET